jgi:hypothetical protein
MERGRVRAAVDEDLPAIAALHAKIYPAGAGGSSERRLSYLNNILFQHPWRDERLGSLLYEDSAGKIAGFLGVMPRPMLINQESVQMAISHNFMVDPESRASLGSVSLAKAFFAGPQTLSVCQPADETSRKLWRACGATPARLYSFTWVWPLRPMAYVVDRLQDHAIPSTLRTVGTHLAKLLDRGGRFTGMSVFHPPVHQHACEELTAEGLLDCIREFSSNRVLKPVYNEQTFKWIFNALQGKRRLGKLIGRQVRRDDGQRLGYYLYYANTNGVSQVLQVGGRSGGVGEVLKELAYDAWKNDAVALSGWLDPHYAEDIAAKSLYLKYDHQAPLLIQSAESAVEFAVGTGRMFLTPLEGEWGLWSHDGTDAR